MVNPYTNPYEAVAGREVSSTSEGRHVNIEEVNLIHPIHADGLVNKGDPVAFFDGVGVALRSAQSNTDSIPVDTEGIWRLSVTNTGVNTFSSIVVGQVLYINAAGVVYDEWSTSFTVFGYALEPIPDPDDITSPDYNGGDPITKIIAVKVHWFWPWWYYTNSAPPWGP